MTAAHCYKILNTIITEAAPLVYQNDHIQSLIDQINQNTAMKMIAESKK